MAAEVAARQLGQGVFAIQRCCFRHPLVEQSERRLPTLERPLTEKALQ